MEKLPPIQKIYEAYSAIAAGRCDVRGEGMVVASSDGTKIYNVEWGSGVYRSTDKATYWQGYPGYPVLAALMLQGKIPYDRRVADWFAGTPWKQLNDAHKRDYDAALQEAFVLADLTDTQIAEARACAEADMEALKGLDIKVGRLRM